MMSKLILMFPQLIQCRYPLMNQLLRFRRTDASDSSEKIDSLTRLVFVNLKIFDLESKIKQLRLDLHFQVFEVFPFVGTRRFSWKFYLLLLVVFWLLRQIVSLQDVLLRWQQLYGKRCICECFCSRSFQSQLALKNGQLVTHSVDPNEWGRKTIINQLLVVADFGPRLRTVCHLKFEKEDKQNGFYNR